MTTSTDYPQGDQMTETPTAAPCTDEQKAEWSELMDQAHAAYVAADRAADMAARYLIDHIEAGAMAPGEFGLPSREAADSYEQACRCAAESSRLRAEWKALSEQAKAHPFNAEVQARREAQA